MGSELEEKVNQIYDKIYPKSLSSWDVEVRVGSECLLLSGCFDMKSVSCRSNDINSNYNPHELLDMTEQVYRKTKSRYPFCERVQTMSANYEIKLCDSKMVSFIFPPVHRSTWSDLENELSALEAKKENILHYSFFCDTEP